ncbi:MAG: type II toxin-antitoxin system VapC family toxin [bacterium]
MIVLDTHVWFFWVNDNIEQLSKNALESIQSNETLGVSIMSCWEIAMLVAKERLRLSIDVQLWVDQALKYPGVKLLAINPQIAVLSTRLPGQFRGDPADRLIVATCMQHHCPLISKDKGIHAWGNIRVIW